MYYSLPGVLEGSYCIQRPCMQPPSQMSKPPQSLQKAQHTTQLNPKPQTLLRGAGVGGCQYERDGIAWILECVSSCFEFPNSSNQGSRWGSMLVWGRVTTALFPTRSAFGNGIPTISAPNRLLARIAPISRKERKKERDDYRKTSQCAQGLCSREP